MAEPKALSALLQRLRPLSRAHSRKVKGSANRRKSAPRLARLHWRISCARGDALHNLTDRVTRLARNTEKAGRRLLAKA